MKERRKKGEDLEGRFRLATQLELNALALSVRNTVVEEGDIIYTVETMGYAFPNEPEFVEYENQYKEYNHKDKSEFIRNCNDRTIHYKIDKGGKKILIMEENSKEINSIVVKSTADTLKSVLLENIENIKKDPKFVPQANTINATVQTYLSVLAQEIECIRLIRQMGTDK